MTKLTAKQEAFCQAIASGMTQADAYRSAYSTAKMSDKTVWENASVLVRDSKVTARLDELKAALAEQQLWTREQSVKTLAAIAKDREAKQADKISAVKALNTMHGFDAPKQLDVNVKEFPTSIDDLI